MVDGLNAALTAAADAVLWPFRALAPVWGLAVFSLLSGVLLLLIYGKISNQSGIRRIKRKISAALLEAVLFRHDLRISLGAQGRMLWYGAVYFAYAVPPILIMMVPCVLLLAQLNLRYNSAGLPPGQAGILRVRLANPNYLDSISLANVRGAEVTPRLRIADEQSVLWRVTPRDRDAELVVKVEANGESHAQRVLLAKDRSQPVPAVQLRDWWWGLLYPGERLLPAASPVAEIVFSYPEARYRLFGITWHWVVLFLVLSIVSGLAASKALDVAV